MASTYDALLRLELQTTGENPNTWGDKTNTNLELVATAIAGATSINLADSGTYTLTAANAATDEARRMTLTFTGTLTGARTVIIPSSSKVYVIRNATTGSFSTTIKTATGAGVTVLQGGVTIIMCDGTDCYLASETGRVAKTGDTMTGTLALPAGTPVSAAQALRYDEVIAYVSGVVSPLDVRLNTVSVQTATNTAAITSINAVVAAISVGVSPEITAALTSINAAITSVNAINNTQNAAITSINTATVSINSAITSVNNRVAAVSASVGVINLAITSINSAHTSTNNSVVSVNAVITSINAAHTSTNAAVVSINAVITSINAAHTSTNAAVVSINTAVYTKTAANAQFVDVAGDTMTGNLNLPSLNTGPLAGFRNALLNGNFQIAQRGTSFVAGANNDDTYNLDRWYVLSDGNDAVDITQDTTTIPTNGSQTAIALDVETANKKFGIAQIIEARNCAAFIGNTVTFSFKARVSSTTRLNNIKAAIIAWDGTADTVTSDIISAWNSGGTNPTLIANATYENTPANLNVTTSYATYSVTAAVDTASAKNIIVLIWSDVVVTAAADFLYVTDAQLELGSTATPFERRPIGIEQLLCQRYFQTFTYRARWDASSATDSDARYLPFPAVMRNVPTGSNLTPSENVNTASATLGVATRTSFGIEVTPTAAGATAWAAELRFDSEL